MIDYAEHSDQVLMELVKESDQQAFTEIHNRYSGVLFVHAFRMLDQEEEAKDLVQDLFTNLWVRRHEISLNAALSSYLYTAIRNRVLDVIARKKTEEKYFKSLAHFLEEGESITDQEIRRKELSALIEREISLLPARMRQIFEMSRKKNQSYKEIAEQLNISDTTVKKQVSNALTILRKKIDTAFTLFLSL